MKKNILSKKNLFNLLRSSGVGYSIVLSALVGVATGFVSFGFIKLITVCENLFFERTAETFSFLGHYWVIFVPVLGGLIVGPLVTYLAPEAKGHGVPEVIKAIVLKRGKIRPLVVVVKAIASAIAIGSGSSVGREGPIIQIGSAIGSSFAQFFKLAEWRIKNLVACGAAAGVAAVFNAPIAGVMFACEVILRNFGVKALGSVIVAAISSSIVSHSFLGEAPAFKIPFYSYHNNVEIFLYLGLGVLSALAAFCFIWVLGKSEHIFDEWKFPVWLKASVGGLIVGCLGFFFPHIFGTGFHTIEMSLNGDLAWQLMLVLVFVKIFATSASLGSGSSGGVFAPSLFIGSVLGGAYGKLCAKFLPFTISSGGTYALVGMASVFAAAAHAPITAIIMVFEMTGSYQMILPIMGSAIIAAVLAKKIQKESIYTIKLKEQGIDIGALEASNFLDTVPIKRMMEESFQEVRPGLKAEAALKKLLSHKNKTLFVVDSDRKLLGTIRYEHVQEILLEADFSLMVADDLMTPLSVYCFPNESLGEAMKLMIRENLIEIPVIDSEETLRVVGVLKSENILRAHTHPDFLSKNSNLPSDKTY